MDPGGGHGRNTVMEGCTGGGRGLKTHIHRQVLVVMGGVDSAQASNSPTLHFPVEEPPQCSSPCERTGE